METHVLIPAELILKVKPSNFQCSSPLVAKFLEQKISVVTKVALPKGLQIYPTQGSVRCGNLEIYSTLGSDDVS